MITWWYLLLLKFITFQVSPAMFPHTVKIKLSLILISYVHTQYSINLQTQMSKHFISTRSNILKLINNSLGLNKGNHHRDSVWISDLI